MVFGAALVMDSVGVNVDDLGYGPRSYAPCLSAEFCVADGDGAYGSVFELDALELHRRLLGFLRLADRARAEFLKYLAILDDGERYLELGFGSSAHYLVQEFHFGRSDAMEHLRIARKLHELPVLAEALSDGELRWSTLKTLSRVATYCDRKRMAAVCGGPHG